MKTYKATNTTNGRFYIGSTKDFEKRKREHLSSKCNYPFQNALRQNPDAFEWCVHSDDYDEPILEQSLLDMWYGKECCYNLNPSAKHPPSWEGKTHKEDTIQKMKVSARESWEGNVDRKEKIKVSLSERVWRQESKDKVGESNNAKWGNAWVVVGPDGAEHTVTNMRKFCRENNLNRSCMLDLVKERKGQKSHRGFSLKG
jgi:group I intron endonuclease